jgi:O-antigen/teichoic acid export membrane protein
MDVTAAATATPPMTSDEDCPPATLAGRPRWLSAARLRGASRWGLALLDQVVVSGSRFLFGIIIGRLAGKEELGRYAVAFNIVILLACVQEALVTTPYAIGLPRLRKRSRRALGDHVFAMHSMLLLALFAIGGLVQGGMALFGTTESFHLAGAVCVAVPLLLMWEFARRMLLAQLDVAKAAILDIAVACLQVIGLFLLVPLDQLTGFTAVAILGLGAALPSVLILYRLFPSRRPNHLSLYFGRHWQLGKWIMGSQIVRALSGVVPVALLAALAGDPAAGVFTACVSIPMMSNPFIFAVGNLLMPKAAHAYGSGGAPAVVRLVVGVIAAFAALFVPFGIVLAVAGEPILKLFYGPRFDDTGLILAVLGVAPVLWAATSALSCGQAALKHTKASFVSTAGGILVSTIVIAALAATWHELGAAIGLVAGAATMCIAQSWQFWRRCRELSRGVSA